MLTLLKKWLGHTIKIGQTGDHTVVGRLVNVQQDYASISTENNEVIHYPYSQIKSIAARVSEPAGSVTCSNDFPSTFEDLVDSLYGRMVRVENGKKSNQGVLTAIEHGYIQIMTSPTDVIFYPLNQIKNITELTRSENEGNKNDGKKDDNKDGNKGGNKGGNKDDKKHHDHDHHRHHRVFNNTRPVMLTESSSDRARRGSRGGGTYYRRA